MKRYIIQQYHDKVDLRVETNWGTRTVGTPTSELAALLFNDVIVHSDIL